MGYFKKGYKRAGYRGSRDKYSVEQSSFAQAVGASASVPVLTVAPIASQGMRKVKHLTVSMSSPGTSATNDTLFWALVYVPQGTSPSALAIASVSGQSAPLYEPNQFVMSCGVFDFSAGPVRIHCPLSRNLNSGDAKSLASVTHPNTLP